VTLRRARRAFVRALLLSLVPFALGLAAAVWVDQFIVAGLLMVASYVVGMYVGQDQARIMDVRLNEAGERLVTLDDLFQGSPRR
jgi:hypothetical protein